MRFQVLILILLAVPSVAEAQNHRKFIREGNREYSKQRYDQSEVEYRRAIDVSPDAGKAVFNLGDALYRMGKFEEAGKEFDRHAGMTEEDMALAAADYNRGNSLLKAGKIEESIEAYKSSLLANPGNHEAKYNLAYAQDLLKQQQQEQQDQDQQKDQDKQDKNKDQDQQQQDNQESDKNQDQKPEDNQQDQDNNQQQQQQNQDQQQNQSSPKMTREDAERLLQALANEEKEVQEKVKKEKAAAARVRVLKNW